MMAEAVKNLHADKSSKNKNTDLNQDGHLGPEQTKRGDTGNEFKKPDRSEVAAAAETRAKEEEARRKTIKERAEKQKEAVRKAEEEEIAAKKRRAAEAGEALERKAAQKNAQARTLAKTAAEGRAEIVTEERGAKAEIAADERVGRPAADERPTRPAADERPTRPAADERAGRPAADERPTRPAADERAGRPAADERPTRPAADERPTRPAADERPTRPAADERPTRPAADERPTRPAADERPGRPAADERPTRPAADERPTRPAAPDFSPIKEQKSISATAEENQSKGNIMKNGALGNEGKSLSCSPLSLKKENQQRDTVRTSNEKPSGKDNGEEKNSQRQSNRTAGEKEAKREEKEGKAVADEVETLEKEAIRAAAAEAAEKRLTKAGSPQNKKEKEIVNTSEKHVTKESSEGGKPEKCDLKLPQNIKEEKSLSPAPTVKERDPVNTAENQAKSQEITGVHQSVGRPEEGINKHSGHAVNTHVGQKNGKTIDKSSINTIHQNENPRYKPEKEIVSVTGEEGRGNSRAGSVMQGGHGETVPGDGTDRSKKSESFRGEGQKSYSHFTEPDKQNRVKETQVEKKQDPSQRYQNEQNSHDRGNTGDSRGYRQQGNDSRRGQQHYLPLAQRDRSFYYQQNHWEQSQQNTYSQHRTPQGSGALICGICNWKYSLAHQIPRNLYCGHSVCTPCISREIYYHSFVKCPDCPGRTWNLRNAEDCPVNKPLMNILYEEIKPDAVTEENQKKGNAHYPVGNDTRQSQSRPGSHTMPGGAMRQPESRPITPRSPHGSKCMEAGVRPSSYCVTCQVWLCDKCAEAEHSTKRCSLRPFKNQLSEMKLKHESVCKKTREQLGNYLQGLENSLDQDRILLLWVKTTAECTQKRQEDMEKKLQEGRKQLKTLTDVMDSVPRSINLPEALAAFQVMKDVAGVARQWTSDAELSVAGVDQETTSTCLRHLMKRTLRSLQVKNGISEMFVVNKIPGGDLFSELRDEGGRFHLRALKKGKPPSQGTLALPLQCFKACQAVDSTLVFLDLSWGRTTRGRLYIRLTGDTLRGRRFISLCTGEESISFQGTCIHRMWWKDLPGEHVWIGDNEKGDGNGIGSPLALTGQEQVPAGRKVPVSAGLVAGRYEKDLSSIFRIYTREEKEGRDEAGFGQVEFGLDVLREAVKLQNITDVVVSDCGLVLEM